MSNIFLATVPNFTFLSLFVKKPILIVGTLPVAVIVTHVDFYKVVWLLFWLFVFDLISGLLASYFDWKKSASKGKFFFGNDQGFSSDKFKKCFIKGGVYGGFPIIVLKFQQIFMIKSFSVNYISEAQIDVTTAILLLFCGNEMFSIFWENLPKCGLDIPKGIRNLITGVKGVNNEIKEE